MFSKRRFKLWLLRLWLRSLLHLWARVFVFLIYFFFKNLFFLSPCKVTIGCGATSSENCTYFTSSTVTNGQCCATICPCGDNICQVRNRMVFFLL